MVGSQALIPTLFPKFKSNSLREAAMIASGVLLLCLLAQVSIPLPFTPVPITGQTFGVSLLAMLMGVRAFGVVAAYLGLGASGLPVFAAGASGLVLGPTIGYLVGMLFAAIIVGALADRGYCSTWLRAYGCSMIGSAAIFACGLANLSFYLPSEQLLTAGFWPFVPGDLLKTAVAVTIVVRSHRTLNPKAR
jgi:biotin transport system substrate-specific component